MPGRYASPELGQGISRLFAMALLILSSIGASTAGASAETWTVVEGEKGSIHGVWQVSLEGHTLAGSAAMLGPMGKQLNYRLAGEIRQGNLVVHRVTPSDGSSCTYLVAMNLSAKLAGTALCGGRSYPWHVTRVGKR